MLIQLLSDVQQDLVAYPVHKKDSHFYKAGIDKSK